MPAGYQFVDTDASLDGVGASRRAEADDSRSRVAALGCLQKNKCWLIELLWVESFVNKYCATMNRYKSYVTHMILEKKKNKFSL